MSERFVITYNGLDYAWSPSRSTPSAQRPIAELPQIVSWLNDRGARSVVDFGSGRGRNVRLLSDSFNRVLLVEDDANIAHLRQLVVDMRARNIRVTSWRKYRSVSAPKVDAVLICFVIHTLPAVNLRLRIIRANVAHLRRRGVIVFITPRNDPKYRPTALADALEFAGGIVRLSEAQKEFSYYRNYTADEFANVIDEAGLRVESTIPSPSRMIFLTVPK